MPLNTSLEENLREIERVSGSSADMVIRRFKIAGKTGAAVVYIDGIINDTTVGEMLHTLMVESLRDRELRGMKLTVENLLDSLVAVDDIQETDSLAGLFNSISTGNTGLLIDGQKVALLCETKGKTSRAVEMPITEATIRGPRDGFTEELRVNTSLVRHRIRVPHLWFEKFEIGKLTQTNVEMAYIKGLVSDKLLQEVRSRLERIDTDSILESGYIEEFIMDNPYTVFPLVLRTERPDKVAAALLEGRVALFCQGSPFVLLLPMEIFMMLQAPEDYYEFFPIGTLVRFVRTVSLVISLLLPGLYVAIINFHPELLPTALLLRITAAREGIPLPLVLEIFLLEFLFEILREAGLRLPQPIGSAVSIVGALILGDAAIRAGIVSPAVVVVIALTAIASFSTPAFSLAIAMRILRFAFIGLGSIMGLLGIQFGVFVLIVHLCSLRSFGVPYLSPLAPFIWEDMKDNFIRLWWWKQRTRPRFTGQRQRVRLESELEPGPYRKGDPEGGQK